MPIINQIKLLALRPNPDMTALRLCFERIIPIPKPANGRFRLPRVRTASDLPKVFSAIGRAIADGQLNAHEGFAMAQITDLHRLAFETGDFDKRIRALEEGGEEIPLKPIEPTPDKGGDGDNDGDKDDEDP
jgi:hypothetical protein